MQVGVIQSNFLPWRGYFDFIREVDLFIIHDDIQYTKNDWRNRNIIKTPNGPQWITVPVNYQSVQQTIEQTGISADNKWRGKMLGRIRSAYHKAPFFKVYFSQLQELINTEATTISELNYRLIKWGCQLLQITTPLHFSREYSVQGVSTERLIDMLSKVGATEYLSGPAAKNYLNESLFAENGIKLTYKKYDYPPYPQLHGQFEPAVSIIDVLFMLGDEAKDYLSQ